MQQTHSMNPPAARPQARHRGYLPRFTRRSAAVWLHEFLSWRRFYRSSVLLNFGEPLLNLIALGWGLGAYISQMGDVSFLQFIGPGLLAVTAMNSVTFDICYEGFDRLHRTGLYTAMTSTSMEVEEVVGGQVLWSMTRSILYGSIFLFVLLLFGLIQSVWSFGIIITLMLSGALFSLAGLIVVSIAKNHEHLFYYFSLIITPMFMFSGVFFPVERLPVFLQWFIQALPLYHFVEMNRALVSGQVDASILSHVVIVLVMIMLLALFPARMLRKALQRL